MLQNLNYFNPSLVLLFCLGFALIIFSCFLFVRGRETPGFLILISGGLCLRIFAALLDPYLNLWDEQFHALVAKNMILHPFKPTLNENPAFEISFSWVNGHVWLH